MLKRGEPELDEAQILMRALRDFNTPKIPAHDTPIFIRLINDLFMGLEVPPKVSQPASQPGRTHRLDGGETGEALAHTPAAERGGTDPSSRLYGWLVGGVGWW